MPIAYHPIPKKGCGGNARWRAALDAQAALVLLLQAPRLIPRPLMQRTDKAAAMSGSKPPSSLPGSGLARTLRLPGHWKTSAAHIQCCASLV